MIEICFAPDGKVNKRALTDMVQDVFHTDDGIIITFAVKHSVTVLQLLPSYQFSSKDNHVVNWPMLARVWVCCNCFCSIFGAG